MVKVQFSGSFPSFGDERVNFAKVARSCSSISAMVEPERAAGLAENSNGVFCSPCGTTGNDETSNTNRSRGLWSSGDRMTKAILEARP